MRMVKVKWEGCEEGRNIFFPTKLFLYSRTRRELIYDFLELFHCFSVMARN